MVPCLHRLVAATSAAVALLAACGETPTPPPAVTRTPELRQLCERLDRLIDTLERPAIAGANGDAVPPVERVAADDEATALRTRIAALEGELAILRAQALGAAGAVGAAVRPPSIEPLRTDAVARMIASRRADEEQHRNDTLRAIFLMGPAQVVQTFGMPSETWIQKNGSVTWVFRAGEDELSVEFVDGQVVRVH